MASDYFENKECPYYPCHDSEHINCLFCFCPLYNSECPGNYKILGNGIKDCSGCVFPHNRENYNRVIKELMEGNHGE